MYTNGKCELYFGDRLEVTCQYCIRNGEVRLLDERGNTIYKGSYRMKPDGRNVAWLRIQGTDYWAKQLCHIVNLLTEIVKRYFLIIWMLALSTLVSAKNKSATITINSHPAGATVFIDGKNVGVTPCNVSLSGKWVQDIDTGKVNNPNNPSYSKKITFVLEGYENATEYWEGTYEYHEAGWGQYRQRYYIVKLSGYSVMAFLQKTGSFCEPPPN